MPETISETKACDLLTRLFRARGYTIARNVLFREYGVEFHVDGWDEKARVGFEFLSSEDEDHIDLSLEEYQTLSDAQRRGELALFIIDEVEPLTSADLLAEAGEFLDEAAAAGRSRRARAARAAVRGKGRAATGARKPAVRGAAAGKKPVRAKKSVKVRAGVGKKTAGRAVGRVKKTAIAKKPAPSKVRAKRRIGR